MALPAATDVQELMKEAFELSLSTPVASLVKPGALAVGAIVLDRIGNKYTSFSGADQGHGHAEELLFAELDRNKVDCSDGTLICTHEPCGRRTKAGTASCADLVVSHGIATVIFAVREIKPAFQSLDYLRCQNVQVIQVTRAEPSRSDHHDRRRIVLALKSRRHETLAL